MVEIRINNELYCTINKDREVIVNKELDATMAEKLANLVEDAITIYDEIKLKGYIQSPKPPLVAEFYWVDDV